MVLQKSLPRWWVGILGKILLFLVNHFSPMWHHWVLVSRVPGVPAKRRCWVGNVAVLTLTRWISGLSLPAPLPPRIEANGLQSGTRFSFPILLPVAMVSGREDMSTTHCVLNQEATVCSQLTIHVFIGVIMRNRWNDRFLRSWGNPKIFVCSLVDNPFKVKEDCLWDKNISSSPCLCIPVM